MNKETIRPNNVPVPTLFVGVGGTGSKIVKRVSELCRPEETTNINFVCLDTNVNDLSVVEKGRAKIYRIQTSTTQTVGDYLDYDLDALMNWFPKNAILYSKSVSEGAGQVRAISRLALNAAIKTGKIAPLCDAIDDLFRKDGSEMKQALRVCIVSTASGGTGSGIILPLSMYIRDYVTKKYPSTAAIVRMLIVLPEALDSVIDSNVEKESQRRNAYATIKELNAFMMQGSGFFEIDPDYQRYQGLHVDVAIPGSDELQSLASLPCDFCFLMDGQNAENNTMVSLSQYITQAAQALYEQNIGPMQKDAFSVEDNIIKELTNHFGRNRFGGIGASVIRYPFEDVVKYIAYDWAIGCIGGEGEAAKWTRYDKEYERQKKEAEKKDLSIDEAPKRAEVYVSKLDNDSDKFSRNLRSKYSLSSSDDRVAQWFDELEGEIIARLNANGSIANALNATNKLSRDINYDNPDERGKAMDNLKKLRGLENAMRVNATKIGENAADAIFYNETKTEAAKAPWLLESVLKNAFGDVMHPNAVRYMLYKIKTEMDTRVESMQSDIMSIYLPALTTYASTADKPEKFNVKYTKKEEEHNLDEMCAAEKDGGQNPSLFEKFGGYNEIYESINKCFKDYYRQSVNYGEALAKQAVYKKGAEYLNDLCQTFEGFYRTFSEKVSAMMRRQDIIVDSLAFKKGDSILNVCASAPILKELSSDNAAFGDEGAMLDSSLNGKIFDAVKQNVAFLREVRSSTAVEEDRRIDIFDDVILEYFINSVRDHCENIDLNVIRAIAMENRLKARIKAREELENSKENDGNDKKVYDKVSQSENERYVSEVLAIGRRLAAPSIQRMNNVESREVVLSAYNEQLDEMRDYRMKVLLPKSSAVDTVSRYEIHFFNALYNLTPDKISKFASYKDTETGSRNAGLYHDAYVSYSRNIGPDSTKNAQISTHIDKRWDSLAAMPELDRQYQQRRVMKIHQAMIYALVHDVISRRAVSPAAGDKRVYKYENSDERYVDLVVSNGTPCDEFYEILDALYISSNIVEDMDLIKAAKRVKDKNRHSNYKETQFIKDLQYFCIETLHDGATSLFEIPIAYYNSLPTSQRYSGEISSLVDAVIQTLRDEIEEWENANDVPYILSEELMREFNLLMDNYKKYETVNNRIPVRDNEVVDTVFRKIRRVLSQISGLESDELIAQMRARIR